MENAIAVVIGIAIGALAMYLFRPSKEHSDERIVKPKGVIPPTEAKILNNEWSDKRKAAVDKAAGRPDNRSSWWSIEDINNYIAYAQHQTKGLGYDMDGIRIFLGVYPANAPNGKADYTTLFMAPTGKKKLATNSLIHIENDDSSGGSDTIDGADVLNKGGNGHPPGSGYP